MCRCEIFENGSDLPFRYQPLPNVDVFARTGRTNLALAYARSYRHTMAAQLWQKAGKGRARTWFGSGIVK